MTGTGPDATELDRIDLRILRELAREGRMTWSDLSERIGLTLTPTLKRVRRLEAAGFIQGYAAVLDESRLGGTMIVFISVTLERQVREVLSMFEDKITLLPEIMSGFLMSGDADYLLRAVVRDLSHYRELLEAITRISGVARIQSSFALKAFVSRGVPLLEGRSSDGTV